MSQNHEVLNLNRRRCGVERGPLPVAGFLSWNKSIQQVNFQQNRTHDTLLPSRIENSTVNSRYSNNSGLLENLRERDADDKGMRERRFVQGGEERELKHQPTEVRIIC